MIALDTTQNCKPAIKAMLDEGVVAVGRYYVANRSSWKCVKKPEAEALSKAGISIFPVYQVRQNRDGDFSAEQGIEASKNALVYAHDVMDQPTGSAVYFAVDYDASPSAVEDLIVPYFESVSKIFKQDGSFDVGVYGSGATCTALLDAGLVKYTWLTQSTGFRGSKDFDKKKLWNIKQLLEERFDPFTDTVDPNELNLDRGYFGTFIYK